MHLNESEAKFKHCPFLTTRDDKLRFCLGSACMMWRWADPDKTGSGERGRCGLAGPVAAKA